MNDGDDMFAILTSQMPQRETEINVNTLCVLIRSFFRTAGPIFSPLAVTRFGRQTFVSVPCEAVEQTRWCKQFRRPDKSDADAAAIGRCRRRGSDVYTVDSGRYHPQSTGVDRLGIAGRALVAGCLSVRAPVETETWSLLSSHSAGT